MLNKFRIYLAWKILPPTHAVMRTYFPTTSEITLEANEYRRLQ